MNKILTLLIFTWLGTCPFAHGALSDYQDLAIDDASKLAVLEQLQSGADLNNVAVIELLLQKAGYLYTNLINKNFAAKQNLVIDYLKTASEPLITGIATEPSVISPGLTGETLVVGEDGLISPDLAVEALPETVELPLIVADDVLNDYEALSIDDASKNAALEQLQISEDRSNNVAVIELLLQKAGYLYIDLINKDFAVKQNLVIDYLKSAGEPLIAGMATESSVILPDLTVGTLFEPVALPLVAADLINLVNNKTGFSEIEIKQRLLNNVVVLEYLLFLLGQDYQESIKSDLAAKQAVLGKIEASALLKTLYDHGYTQDQLVLLVNNSSSQAPIVKKLNDKPKEKLINSEVVLEYLPLREYSEEYSPQEYEYFMNIIKKVSPNAYAQLIHCASILGKHCLKQSKDTPRFSVEKGQEILWLQESLIRLYASRGDSKSVEIFIMKNLKWLGFDSDEVIDTRQMLVPKKLEVPNFGPIPDFKVNLEDSKFNSTQYAYLMSMIYYIDPVLHQYLEKCSGDFDSTCISKSNLRFISYDLNTSPFLFIPRSFLARNDILYDSLLAFSEGRTTDVFGLIKELAPSFADKINKRFNIIYQSDTPGIAAVSCGHDGFPLIAFGRQFTLFNRAEQKFIIAHELSHYALGHCVYTPEASGIKGLDNYQDSFKKSYSRIQESEADRFAVVRLGASPDAGISWLKSRNIKNKSIGSTHPSYLARIEQLEEIKREMALRPVNNLEPIDWDAAKQICLDFHHRLPLG